tara:strand:- start:635 stop:1774 length:1140 start_codon:yes stop_codon:yes gene_type:complete
MRKEEKIIQPLDIENNCIGVYAENKFIFKEIKDAVRNSTLAWRHSSIFEEDQAVTYLNIFIKNQDIAEYSSDPLAMQVADDLLKSQKKAAITAKIDFSDLCFYDILPDHLMGRWFSLREEAMRHVLNTIPKPSDYDILHKIHVLTTNIASQRVNVGETTAPVRYDIFSSATGRLATTKGSYPIMNIKKEERVSVRPQNDMFLELDLNGAEIRTLLAFSGIKQPSEDIHLWNMKDMPPWTTRSEAKEQFFAWLYNPKAENEIYEKYYNKKAYLDHYDGETIKTPFGRVLPVEERKALNYLLQSTTSDIVLNNAYEIMKKLKGTKSFVAFTMHDSVVLDFAREDYGLVSDLKEIFETNLFGKFLSSVSIGKNFGDMRKIEV